MRIRSLRALLLAAIAVLFVGAFIASGTGDALRQPDSAGAAADARPCLLDMRCGGQATTTATGPLVPPQAWSALLAVAVIGGALVVGRASLFHDRLAGSRLFRPPRLAG